jgi:hypothetical protein
MLVTLPVEMPLTSPSLEHLREAVENFHQLRSVFIEAGVRTAISLPRQHALKHFYHAIHLFGSPNGLCSSITESKHIEEVKKTWRQVQPISSPHANAQDASTYGQDVSTTSAF